MKVSKRKRAAAAPVADAAKEAAVACVVVEDAADVAVAETAAVQLPEQPAAAFQELPAQAESPGVVLALASTCTVKDAAALKQSLCAVVESEDAVTLDARSLERIDTAAVQVLCAFVRQRVAAARSVVWLGVPAALQEAADLLGVTGLLALPSTGAAK